MHFHITLAAFLNVDLLADLSTSQRDGKILATPGAQKILGTRVSLPANLKLTQDVLDKDLCVPNGPCILLPSNDQNPG